MKSTIFMTLALLLTLPPVLSAEPLQSNEKAPQYSAERSYDQQPAAPQQRTVLHPLERVEDLPPRAVIDSRREHVRYRRHLHREMALSMGQQFSLAQQADRLNGPGQRHRGEMRGVESGSGSPFLGEIAPTRAPDQRRVSALRGPGSESRSATGHSFVDLTERQDRGQRASGGPRH
jgi:hypothetical protein